MSLEIVARGLPIDTPDRAPDPPARPALLSSGRGRIRHILCSVTGRFFDEHRDLVEHVLRLGADIDRLSLIVHRSAIGGVRRMAASLNVRAKLDIIPAPNAASLWSWTQDKFLAQCDGTTQDTLLLTSTHADDDTARFVAQVKGVICRPDSPIWFEGGNVLVDDDFYLVGADILDMWCRTHVGANDKTPGDRRLAKTLATAWDSDRRPIFIGIEKGLARRGLTQFQYTPGDWSWMERIDQSISQSGSRQPIFHIDMFLSLAGPGRDGKHRILVGDPALASRMIGTKLPPGVPIKVFDEIARSLHAQGFTVIRNPLPLIYTDDVDARLREWFYASSNNCLTERCADGRNRVWLPQYGSGDWDCLQATDAANARIWEELGYEIVPAGNFLSLADQLGSLNCLVKVLTRD